jgi:hypothetical protein
MIDLPHISDRGPARSGENAVANMNAPRAVVTPTLVKLSSDLILGKAGAIMVETIIRLNPLADRTAVTIRLRDAGQLSGSSVSAFVTGSGSMTGPVVLDSISGSTGADI